MAITKVSRGLLSTGVSDSSDATAITIDSSENVTFAGGLVIPSTITHVGDTDTKLDFNQANTLRLITGDNTAWVCNASSMVINEDSIDFDFRVESNNNANMLFVDGGNDRVGINGTGTNARGGSNTVALFDVSGSGKNYVEIQGATDSTANGLLFSDGSSGNYGVLGYDHANDVMNFFTAGSERMRITDAGKIGVGMSSPSQTIHVHSTSEDILGLQRTGTSTGAAYIKYINDGGNAYIGIDDSTGGRLFVSGGSAYALSLTTESARDICFGTNNTERMRLDSSGNLLLGTTSQLQSDNKLSISGSGTGAGNAIMDVRNTASSDTCGCIALSKASTTTDSSARFIWFFANNFSTSMGAIGGNGASNVQFVTASDERLKENIKPLTGSLDKVLALNPVSYTWKESGEDIKAGFVAQEVEKILPEYTATEEDEMKTKSLTGGMTAGYIAVLTKAIQELSAEVEELKTKLESK